MGGEQAAKVMAIVTEASSKREGKPVDQRAARRATETGDRADSTREIGALFATARLWDDGIIDPRDTRTVLAFCLSICREAERGTLQSTHVRRRAHVRMDSHEIQRQADTRSQFRRIVELEDSIARRKSIRTSTNGRRPRHLSRARTVQEDGRARLSRPEQAGGVRRARASTIPTRWRWPRSSAHIHCGGVPMAIGVQTDMATPALARFGSDELRREFLAPSIAGDYVACLGVSEVGAGSDVASIKTTRAQGRRRLRHQRRQDVDHQRHAGRLDVPAGQHRRRAAAQEQVADLRADEDQGREHRAQARQARHALAPTPRRSSSTTCACRSATCIGEEGKGFIYQMLQFQEERLWGAASALAAMDTAIDETIDYTRERQAFGKPILDNQVVHFRLAELQTEVELLRSLVYRAVRD